jgi:MYXO-CTERM domain-containing protein
MRKSFILCAPFLVSLALASSAGAATLYVSPTGTQTSGCLERCAPCTLSDGANAALPGDTVVLMDGVYTTSLFLTTTGGTESAWISFEADECATPIIEGPGNGPMEDVQNSGVGSAVAQYVRFKGIVTRGWNIGFGNGWADGVDSDEISNGHWEIENCASYSNGRTGFTFFSAEGFKLKHSISAHNGSSELHSWSSGVTLFEAFGDNNVVEGVVSFENTDNQRRTDGSGFIVDELSNNATFINNIAFGNGGSCLRLTDSSGTKFINNTCYHNARLGSRATGPSNPSEIYFTNGGVTQQGVMFMNNAIVGTGEAPAGSQAIVNQPSSGWMSNAVMTGSTTYFTAPTGSNPDFVPATGDTNLIEKGGTGTGVPTDDIGFDQKCLVKRAPVMVGQVAAESWWEYDVDIDYIKSIGGVGKCFNPTTRSGTPDIGAYKAGAVTTATPGACMPPPIPPPCVPSTGGAGGMDAGGAAGSSGTGVAGDSAGGTGGGAGGSAPVAGTTSASGSGGAGVSAGGTQAQGGAAGNAAGNGPASGGTGPTAGTGSDVGGSGMTGPSGEMPPGEEPGGCGCRVRPNATGSLAAVGLLGLGLFALRRRRRAG